jgi:hypothetical protein
MEYYLTCLKQIGSSRVLRNTGQGSYLGMSQVVSFLAQCNMRHLVRVGKFPGM